LATNVASEADAPPVQGTATMPEITDSELRMFVRYQNMGTPEEIQRKINDLVNDNGSQRDMIRGLQEKIPAEGHVVLPKEEADMLPKYKELGEPKDLKAQITKGDEAVTRLSQIERKLAATSFAKAVNLAEESIDTLLAIPALENAVFEVKKAKDGDKAVITLDNKSFTFDEAKEEIPALKGLRSAEPGKPGSVRYLQQGAAEEGGSPDASVYEKIRAEKKKEQESRPKVKTLEERLHMKTTN
jgi:hypothetical protein